MGIAGGGRSWATKAAKWCWQHPKTVAALSVPVPPWAGPSRWPSGWWWDLGPWHDAPVWGESGVGDIQKGEWGVYSLPGRGEDQLRSRGVWWRAGAQRGVVKASASLPWLPFLPGAQNTLQRCSGWRPWSRDACPGPSVEMWQRGSPHRSSSWSQPAPLV